MARPLLHKPRQRWRIGAALGAAALIHFAAIALASIHRHDQLSELPPWDDSSPPLEIIPDSPIDSATPPPDVVDPPPILKIANESMFPEDRPTPTPVRRPITKLTTPILKVKGTTIGFVSLSSARVSALSAPRPEYPYEARRQKVTGNGIVVMTVDSITGRVTDVVMEASTGSSVLDNAAIAGFRKWRFKPGTASRVKSPITFTMTGAQY